MFIFLCLRFWLRGFLQTCKEIALSGQAHLDELLQLVASIMASLPTLKVGCRPGKCRFDAQMPHEVEEGWQARADRPAALIISQIKVRDDEGVVYTSTKPKTVDSSEDLCVRAISASSRQALAA